MDLIKIFRRFYCDKNKFSPVPNTGNRFSLFLTACNFWLKKHSNKLPTNFILGRVSYFKSINFCYAEYIVCPVQPKWSWLCGLITPLHLAVYSPSVIWQESASGHLLSRGQKSAVNSAQSSYSSWVTSRSRQRAGIGDLLSSPGITCKRYTDWSHNKLNTPHLWHTQTLSKAPRNWGELRAARKGSLLLFGLFSFTKLRYCTRVSRDDSSD